MSGVGMGFGRERGMFWLLRGEECLSFTMLPAILSTERNKSPWEQYKMKLQVSSPQPTAVGMPFWASDANILFKYFIFHPQDTKKQVFKVNWVFFHKLECEIPWTGLLEADQPWWSKLGLKFAQLLTHIAINSLEEKPKTKDTAAAKRALAQPGLQELVSTVSASRSQIQTSRPSKVPKQLISAFLLQSSYLGCTRNTPSFQA